MSNSKKSNNKKPDNAQGAFNFGADDEPLKNQNTDPSPETPTPGAENSTEEVEQTSGPAGTGSEAPSKQKPQTGKKRSSVPWIGAIVLLIGTIITVSWYWFRAVEVEHITVEGNGYTAIEHIVEKMNVPMGTPADSIQFIPLVEGLEQLPYIERAYAHIEPSGDLMVRVEERQPVALVAEGASKFYIDSNGIVLPIITGKTADVPVVYGIGKKAAGDTLQSTAVTAITGFINAMENKPVADASISELAYVKGKGIIAMAHDPSARLLFGHGDFSEKLENWTLFYQSITVNGLNHPVKEVDLRFKGQVITRKS